MEEFDLWNEQKKLIEINPFFKTDEQWKRHPKVIFKEWEIWWCKIWRNIGREIYGKWTEFTRPVYILRKISSDACIAIPVSSQDKSWTWFQPIDTELGKQVLILPQVRLISASRLSKRMLVLPEPVQEKIKKAFLNFFR